MASPLDRWIRRLDAVPVAPAAAAGAALGTVAGAALLWAPSVPRVVVVVALLAAAIPLSRAARGATEVVPAARKRPRAPSPTPARTKPLAPSPPPEPPRAPERKPPEPLRAPAPSPAPARTKPSEPLHTPEPLRAPETLRAPKPSPAPAPSPAPEQKATPTPLRAPDPAPPPKPARTKPLAPSPPPEPPRALEPLRAPAPPPKPARTKPPAPSPAPEPLRALEPLRAPDPERDPRTTLPMDMVELPGGTFWMGSRDDDPLAHPDEKPRHRVEVGPVAIGRYPVTQAQYAAVMDVNPGEPQGDALPVNNVSWEDAVRFCNRLSEREGLRPAYILGDGKDRLEVTWDREADGYRLPTEAEWEYAARGGTDTAWSFGDDESMLGEHAWYRANSGGQVQPVGQKKANPFRIRDVHGNVWEWCWDWFGTYVTSPDKTVDPVGPPSGDVRVLRGGSWDYFPRRLRSAFRFRDWPTFRYGYVGFRCARAVPRQHGR